MTTKSKKLATDRLYRLMYEANFDNDIFLIDEARRHIPDAWHTLEMDVDVDEPKEKVTLYLDRSVARMFRAMGHGYQARINRVLATYVQMRIAELKALQTTHMEAIGKAGAELHEPEPTPLGRPKELHDHWAYLQGVADTKARLKR